MMGKDVMTEKEFDGRFPPRYLSEFEQMPRARIELEGLKYTMYHMLDHMQLKMTGDIKAAVEEFCQPEHLTRVIRAETEQALYEVVRDTVKDWFDSGSGREAIGRMVVQTIEERLFPPIKTWICPECHKQFAEKPLIRCPECGLAL